MLGADLFVESIAPGNLPFIFAMIAFWTGAGGWIVVMYGALNTIPHELEEAARIDGAGPITIALRLKLPLIRKWIAYMVILSFATGTQLFVEPQLVNQASLGMVPDTWSSNQLAYQLAFRYADFNGAAAIAVDLLAIGLVGRGADRHAHRTLQDGRLMRLAGARPSARDPHGVRGLLRRARPLADPGPDEDRQRARHQQPVLVRQLPSGRARLEAPRRLQRPHLPALDRQLARITRSAQPRSSLVTACPPATASRWATSRAASSSSR